MTTTTTANNNNNEEDDRYSSMKLIYGTDLFNFLRQSPILIVGAGGIGCELVKNLVLTGFEHIDIIDLDTIDVSNLNRQFLFRQHHVGQPKSLMAKEAAMHFNPNCRIEAHHGNIKSGEYGPQWFKKFKLVLNALDNVDARRHVNRMCLASNVVMLDGGTAGYLGQVKSYQKNWSECYECYQKPTQKTFAVCTIRSNPSTPVHCIVWAKLLFERCFGKVDDSNAVSSTDFETLKKENAENDAAFADAVFEKVFCVDVSELTALKKNRDEQVWSAGRAPEPLDESFVQRMGHSTDSVGANSSATTTTTISSTSIQQKNTNGEKEGAGEEEEGGVAAGALRDQKILNLNQNIQLFKHVTKQLRELKRLNDERDLVFDKDDDLALDFVTSAANLRAFNFHIAQKSRFDVKAIAGNIVPAIATTNAVIAGFLVTEGIKVLRSMFNESQKLLENNDKEGQDEISSKNHVADCVEIELRRTTAKKNRKDCLILSVPQRPPNSQCYVCSSNYLSVECNTHRTTLAYFVSEILQKRLALMEPTITVGFDIVYECGSGLEQDELEAAQAKLPKAISALKLTDQTSVSVEDFLQDVDWTITIIHNEQLELEEFKIVGKTEAAATTTTTPSSAAAASSSTTTSNKHELEKPTQDGEDNDDLMDDMIMLDDYGREPEKTTPTTTPTTTMQGAGAVARKRKRVRDDESEESAAKKQKMVINEEDVITLD